MLRHVRLGLALGSFLAAACNADLPTSSSGADQALQGNSRPAITVMTRNLYIGADVDQVIGALVSPDPTDDFPSLINAISVMQETDFPTRARALAAEIAANHPHVVGLQEVTDLDIDLSGYGVPVTIQQRFLSTLQSELAARGLSYAVAGQVTNIQAAPIPGISLVDYDAILVDQSRVSQYSLRAAQNFQLNIGVVAPGVELKRGYVAIDAVVDGKTYAIASTHLESGSQPGLDQLRAAQAIELMTVLGSTAPAIVLGDLNDVPGSLMYQVIGGAGFGDLWTAARPGERGFTCCHLPNLANESATFTQRIDFVFARGFGDRGSITRIGDSRSDMVAGPLHSIWPSDHAGLVANLAGPLP